MVKRIKSLSNSDMFATLLLFLDTKTFLLKQKLLLCIQLSSSPINYATNFCLLSLHYFDRQSLIEIFKIHDKLDEDFYSSGKMFTFSKRTSVYLYT